MVSSWLQEKPARCTPQPHNTSALRNRATKQHDKRRFSLLPEDSHLQQAHAAMVYLQGTTDRNRTDISELLSLPGIARCNTDQPVQVDQTTLVGEPHPS